MRRNDREITDKNAIDRILSAAAHGHLGLCDGDEPYVVPMNFAWNEGKIYLHCAREGRKLDIIKNNPKVCFQVDSDTKVVEGEKTCGWGMLYSCVIIVGMARLVEDEAQKGFALECLMKHFKPDFDHKFTSEEINSVAIIEIAPEKISTKARIA